MGYRLHVCKTYKVEYGNGHFSRFYDCINTILSKFCSAAIFNEGDTIEISKYNFQLFLNEITENKDKVISIIKDFVDNQFYKEEIGDIDEYCNDEYNDILQGFKEIYEQADKDNNYIRLEWF